MENWESPKVTYFYEFLYKSREMRISKYYLTMSNIIDRFINQSDFNLFLLLLTRTSGFSNAFKTSFLNVMKLVVPNNFV